MNTPDKRVEEKVEKIMDACTDPDFSPAQIRKVVTEALTQYHQDLMREVVEELEGMKFEWLTQEEIKEHEGCRYKKGGLFVGQVAGENYNQALTEAQNIIKSK